MYMIFFVLDNPDLLDEVLHAWGGLGVSGVTIMESTGYHRRKRMRFPMPYLYGNQSNEESGNYTLWTLVSDEETVQNCLQAAEKVTGSLDLPNSGVFAAWPVPISKGAHCKPGPPDGG